MARVLVLANQKGGVGKTTSAVNLACCLATAGRRCLLIDLDPQANATSGLGIDPAAVADRVHPLLWSREGEVRGLSLEGEGGWLSVQPSTGLRVLPAAPILQEVERQIAALADGHLRLARLVEGLRERYEFIFIDCPPSLGLLTVNALHAGDAAIVPVQCEYFALEGLSRILGLIEQVGSGRGTPLELAGFLLTMFEPGHQICWEVEQEVRSYFGDRVFRTVVPRDASLAEAPSHGRPIIDYAPRSPGAHAYVELTREVFSGG